jgi:hypothetical protein
LQLFACETARENISHLVKLNSSYANASSTENIIFKLAGEFAATAIPLETKPRLLIFTSHYAFAH